MAFDFDELDEKDPVAEVAGEPVFCGWYSGGFFQKQGEALLEPLFSAVRKQFPKIDTIPIHYPDVYGIEGRGCGPWQTYIDRVIEEIDKEPSRRGRPLFLFGHSRGNAPAMSVAARLGSRVLKVYIASSPAPVHGQPSPFQQLSETFQATGDIGLLKWFVSLNPGNKMMEGMCESVEKGEMKVEDSKFLFDMICLMRKQYRDAIYPEMPKDFAGVSAPILALWPRLDYDCTEEGMQRWGEWTSGGVRVKRITGAGHMDCLAPQMIDGREECVLIDTILRDMAATLKGDASH